MSAANCYDLEGVLETAIWNVLTSQFGLSALTYQAFPVEIQRKRPRVNVKATQGVGKGRWTPVFQGVVPNMPPPQLALLAAALGQYPNNIPAANVVIGQPIACNLTSLTPPTLALLGINNPTTGLVFYRRESAWSMDIEFECFTDDDIAAHTAYRTQVRTVLAQLWTLINNFQVNNTSVMPNHALMLEADNGSNGTEVGLEGEQKDCMRTVLKFSGSLSIQAYAWAQLTQ